ncbi:MAG: tetratricopeptide repeat protein [Sandaracinaceae bacterium]|nr:tetratricopeptide repeat protein [Sandaracinaceae bacterium]
MAHVLPSSVSSALCLALLLLRTHAAAQPDSTYEGEARALFEAGLAAYEGGRFEEALRYFQRSYELSGRPELLNNIGTAAERAREDQLALSAYESFLERVEPTEANAPARARAETRIADLRARLAREAEPIAAPASAEDAPVAGPTRAAARTRVPEERADGGVAPWILVAAGAAVAVAGGIVLGVGLVDRAAVEDPPEGAAWTDETAQAYERAPALLTSGVVMLPLGVVLATVGVVWGLVAQSDGSSSLSVRVGPTTVALAGSFQ